MQTMISYCGLDCAQCPAFIARRDNDQALREKTALEWSLQFQTEVNAETIDCSGCCAAGPHSSYCGMCEIKTCATAKEVVTCAHCPDYGCEMLAKVHSMDAHCKARLDEIREGLQGNS